VRLFIAVDFPEEIKQALFDTSTELMRLADAGRIVPLENFHITLVFIGESERISDIQDVMNAVCRTELPDPLRLVISGIGSFPGRKGKGYTWWVGVQPNPDFSRLASKLAEELRLIGLNVEKRAFKPHVTIGRGVVTSRAVSLELPELELTANTISLMRSDKKNGRQVYREIFSCSASL
jgi:2'-5' RNA ligase